MTHRTSFLRGSAKLVSFVGLLGLCDSVSLVLIAHLRCDFGTLRAPSANTAFWGQWLVCFSGPLACVILRVAGLYDSLERWLQCSWSVAPRWRESILRLAGAKVNIDKIRPLLGGHVYNRVIVVAGNNNRSRRKGIRRMRLSHRNATHTKTRSCNDHSLGDGCGWMPEWVLLRLLRKKRRSAPVRYLQVRCCQSH